MAPMALAALETLLRTHHLDATLASAHPFPAAGHASHKPQAAATGIASLDRQLGGGFPRGQVSALAGPRSSGRTSVLYATLAAATTRGETVALVDTFDTGDPESAVACGIDLARLLWIRMGAGVPGMSPTSFVIRDRAIGCAIKALSLVLQAGGFGVVALDLIEAPAAALRRIPFTTWMRLQRAIEGGAVACVVVGSTPLGRSAGGVTVALAPAVHAAGPTVKRERVGTARGGGAPRALRMEPPRALNKGGSGLSTVDDRLTLQPSSDWLGEDLPGRVFRGLTVEARVVGGRRGMESVCRFQTGTSIGQRCP